MLTYEDCLALCELEADEVEAIAEHEHIPEIAAAELGNYLVTTVDGQKRIRHIIVDDIRHARTTGNLHRAAVLRAVLKRYLEHHAAA